MSDNPYESPPHPAEELPPGETRREGRAGAVAYGVVVRSFGLAAIFWGMWYILTALMYAGGAPEVYEGDKQAFFISGVYCTVAGAILLGMARQIVRFSYPGA